MPSTFSLCWYAEWNLGRGIKFIVNLMNSEYVRLNSKVIYDVFNS